MKIFNQRIIKKSFQSLLIIAIFFSFISAPNNSYAADYQYGPDHFRSCDSSGNHGGIEFDPAKSKDILFVLDNPVCLAVVLGPYALVKGLIATMNNFCDSGDKYPRPLPSPFQDAIDFARATSKSGSSPACTNAYGAALSSYAGFVIALATAYGTATIAYDHSSICGSNWLKPSTTSYNISVANYKNTVEQAVKGYITAKNDTQLSLSNKTYREWYYGGVEVDDNPNTGSTCRDVTQPKVNGSYPPQKYYLRGTQAGNFNCQKYNPLTFDFSAMSDPPSQSDVLKAFNCCKDRSSDYICIKTSDGTDESSTFCQSGANCILHGITYSVAPIDDGRMLCAESYSVCPYNFSIGGGSQQCDYFQDGIVDSKGNLTMITEDNISKGQCANKSEIRNEDCTYNAKAGQCRNYCQYLTNCTVTSGQPYVYASDLNSPYFSRACLDFTGDSRNDVSYNTGLLGTQRHFSAPIAQCFKETMENVFYDRVGHSVCLDAYEKPDEDGVCASGKYVNDTFIYQMGQHTMSKSFFATLQSNLQTAVKMVLTLSIMFYGMNVLLGGGAIKKTEILMYIVKIGLVLYFSTGDAWQTVFFDGVYNASSVFSELVFKIEVSAQESGRDGCQFGDMTFADGTTTVVSSATRAYPDGKDYLAMWDTLDCKIARYLGFGPQASTANIISLLFAGMFTGVYGLYFALAVMYFGLYLIMITIRALHIFLSSVMSILILVYISPLIIPMVMFKRTSNIFSSWLSNLIGFCLQPMILFAYIAIFITVLDKTTIGSATFHGTGPSKTISCEKVCKDLNGNIITSNPNCDALGQTLVDPYNDSVACLINVNSFGKFPGFELIGVSIPIITNLFSGDVKAKILTMMKGAFVMFVLCQFMDQIAEIGTDLVGGKGLKSESFNIADMRKKIMKAAQGAQERFAGGLSQLSKATRSNSQKMADYANKGNKPKAKDPSAGAKDDKSGGGDDGAARGGGSASSVEIGSGGEEGGGEKGGGGEGEESGGEGGEGEGGEK